MSADCHLHQSDSLTRVQLCNSLFELCDTWTRSLDAEEYVRFLGLLLDRVCIRGADGLTYACGHVAPQRSGLLIATRLHPNASLMASFMLIRYAWRDQAEISFDSSLAMDGNGRGAIDEGGQGGEGEATGDTLETALHPRTERLRRHTERRLERQGAIKTIQSAQRGKRGRHKASTRERCGRFGRF